jgi:lipopolysaccharide biosynthesis protein
VSVPASAPFSPPASRAPASPAFRAIAFYLPQFHPTRENDEWWGKGFTEWTNVAKARPLFWGHQQPRLPADLGFYDLRVPEVREAQAELARAAGIEGFCYWHYWFAGRRILERPIREVLASGRPDFPFCFAWANETWQGVWHGCERRTLIEQTYLGQEDCDRHFAEVLPAFRDPRYIRVEGRPLFVIYQPAKLPDAAGYLRRWQELAVQHGLPGIHFVAHTQYDQNSHDWRRDGFAASIAANTLKVFHARAWDVVRTTLRHRGKREALRAVGHHLWFRILQRFLRWPGAVYRYRDAILFMGLGARADNHVYPTAVPNWDNAARAGRKAVILDGSTPELYRGHLREVLRSIQERSREHRIVFVKSWNEWAEGNYLEPDRIHGRAYLDVTREELHRAPGERPAPSPEAPAAGLRR